MSSENKGFPNIDPKCPQHSSKRPSALSSTILDYYHQYGQNRDLERYLRFRRSYRSSSSGSIQLSPPDADESGAHRVGKSLENLNILQSCLEAEKKLQKSKSSESLNKSDRISKSEGGTEKLTSEENPTDNQVKLTSKKVLKSKKKYNINMDTSIEITFPQQTLQQSHQQQMPIPFESSIQQVDFAQQKIEFGTCETQTEKIGFPKTPKRSEIDNTVDIPARSSSVASSVASISNKQSGQRLEWDSMADVGYNKSTEMSDFTNLTEFERKALRKFFAARGVSFDDEMVVFASKSKIRSTSVPELGETKQAARGWNRERWEVAFRKILEEKYTKKSEKLKEAQADGKRLWESAIKKFREKYGTRFNPESDLCITDPTVHSTPILSDTAKGAVPKVRNRQIDPKEQREEVAKKQQTELFDKACQTSLITMSSKECQIEQRVSDQLIELEIQGLSSTDNSKESEKSTDGKGLISAASFEFFAPETYNVQDKENIPPWNKENVFPQEIHLRERENKENIPPKSLHNNESVGKLGSSINENIANEPNSTRTDDIFGTISNLENDLTKGVEMLCSLADSKELDEEKKKKLVRKMIRRMIKAKYNDSTPSSQSIISSIQERPIDSDSSKSPSVICKKNFKSNISGVTTLSSGSTSTSRKESSLSSAGRKVSIIKPTNSNENSMKDWLQPMTHSERDHQQNQLISKQKEMDEKLIEAQRKFLTKSSSHSEDSKFNSNVLKFVQKQRNSQLDWLDKEICHLVNLKEFLNSEKKKREMDIMKDIVNLDLNGKQDGSASIDEWKNAGVIYENIAVRSRSTKNHYAEVRERSNKERPTTCTNSNSHTSIDNHNKKENFQLSNEKDAISHESSSVEWNSHINMQQIVRNRTKLQTPNDDIATYAQAKQQEFMGKYESIRARPIYTQPYSSDNSDGHYSEPRDNDRKTSSKKTTNDVYTSITGSDVFLSSDSVSIAVANSTSNTTTHQYDAYARASVAVQTTSSLTRTAPIFNVKGTCYCKTPCNCANTRRPTTIRVKTQTNDKQLQIMPKAISYDLTFKYMTKQRRDNQMRIENMLGRSESQSSTSSSKDSNKNSEKNFIGNFGGCAKLSLQDHLKSARPDFVSHADERRKCVIELHNLREKRNEQRNRLFLLSSNQSLRNHVNSLNPPPMAVKRIFTTKGLKQQTRNRYNKLPEIVRKEEIERQNRIKRSNRVVRDMFNKNLQKRVLKGQTDLSNSVSVAAI